MFVFTKLLNLLLQDKLDKLIIVRSQIENGMRYVTTKRETKLIRIKEFKDEMLPEFIILMCIKSEM